MKSRMKGCMKCGGKMKYQGGGANAIKNRPLNDTTVQQHINDVTGKQESGNEAAQSQQQQQSQNQYFQNPMNLGLGMMAATTGLSWLSGMMDRRRQDQYMYNQYATLGQMQPVPINDYQPNPYNLYMRMGGNLKHYKNPNHLQMIDKGFTNDAEMDFGTPIAQFGGIPMARKMKNVNFYGMGMPMMTPEQEGNLGQLMAGMNPDLSYINDRLLKTMKNGGLSRSEDYGSKSHPYPGVASEDFAGPHRSYPIPTKADAIDALRLAHLHGRSDVIAKVHEKYPELKKGGWLKEAVNPDHKGWCTPLSNPHCTGHRRAFAMMMKKKHGFHKD